MGREAELAFLMNSFDSAKDGQGSLVLVSGQEGIGKSRLVRELKHHIIDQDKGVVLSGSCCYHRKWIPYHLFRNLDIFQGKGVGKNDAPAGTAEPMEMIPGGLPLSPEPLSTVTWDKEGMNSPELIRQNMFYNVYESLTRLTDRLPLLFVLEDIHCADSSSLQLLHFLARNLSRAKILIVATYAPEEMITDGHDPVARLTHMLRLMKREMLCEKTDLTGLSRADTQRLIDWYVPGNLFSASFHDALYVTTGGSPYRLRMVLESMLWEQIILEKEGVWTNRREIRPVGHPSTTGELIRRRMTPFDSNVMTVLECAATVGLVFHPDILAEAIGTAVPLFTDILDALERVHRIIHRDGDVYQFDHSLISRELYGEMSAYRRSTMHQEVANAIRRLKLQEPFGSAYDLALHFSLAGDEQAALPYMEKAGKEARDCLAFPEALHYFDTALSLVEKTPDLKDKERRRIQLLICTGEMHQALGHWEASLEEYRRVQSLMQELGDDRTEGQAFMHMGLAYAKRSMWSEAESLYEQSLVIFRRIGDTEHVGSIMASLADIDLARGHWSQAQAHNEQALTLAMQATDTELMAKVHSNLGTIADIRGDLMGAILNYSKSLDLYIELEDHLGMARMYHALGMMHADWQKWEKAADFYDRCIGLSERLGEVGLMSLAYLHKAAAALHLKEEGEAETMCDVAQRYLLRVEDVRGMAQCNKVLGLIGLVRNEWHYAQRRFEECIRLLESCGDSLCQAQCLSEMGAEYAAHGKKERALLLLAQSEHLYEELDIMSRAEELRNRMKALSVSPA